MKARVALALFLTMASSAFAEPRLPMMHPYGSYVVEVRVRVSAANTCASSREAGITIDMGGEEYGPFRSYEEAESWAKENVYADRIGEIRQLKVPAQILESPAARTLPLVTLKKAGKR